MIWIYICMGGIFGSIGRYWFGVLLENQFPNMGKYYSTLLINMFGSFLLGIVLSLNRDVQNSIVIFGIAVGVLGSFTTYSTFSLDCIKLLVRKEWTKFFQYSVATFGIVILSFLVGTYFLSLTSLG